MLMMITHVEMLWIFKLGSIHTECHFSRWSSSCYNLSSGQFSESALLHNAAVSSQLTLASYTFSFFRVQPAYLDLLFPPLTWSVFLGYSTIHFSSLLSVMWRGYKGIFALLGNLCHVMTTSVVQVIEGLSEQLETALAFFGNWTLPFIMLASLCQVIPEDVVKSLLAACRSGEFDVANKEVSNIIAEGYPVSQLMAQVIYLFLYLDIIL